jgi:hypothetical protein
MDGGKPATLLYFDGSKHYLQLTKPIDEMAKALKMFDADG